MRAIEYASSFVVSLNSLDSISQTIPKRNFKTGASGLC